MKLRSDQWQPSAEIKALVARAELMADIRQFFSDRAVMEVDTPVLGRYGVTDPSVQNIAVRLAGTTWFLQSSPEYAMKRLLAAGSGPIFQVTRAFRGGEQGRLHNVEFTMLEWYRPAWTMEELMDEVQELVRKCMDTHAIERIEYRDLLANAFDVDVLACDETDLRTLARRELSGLSPLVLGDVEAVADLLYDEALARLRPSAFVHRFPASRAALAQVCREGDAEVALRFELVVDGIELANGYQELTDVDEQRRRFQRDVTRRAQRGQDVVEIDERLLAAMAHGLPECSGVALGVDRLLMRKLGCESLAEVIAFPQTLA